MTRNALIAIALIGGTTVSAEAKAPAVEFVEAMKVCHAAVGYNSIDTTAFETFRWRGEALVGGKTRYVKTGHTVVIETEQFANGKAVCRVQGVMATKAADVSKAMEDLLGAAPTEISNGSAVFYGGDRSYQLRWTPDNRASITVAR